VGLAISTIRSWHPMDEMTPLRLALFLADGRAWFAGFAMLASGVLLQTARGRVWRAVSRLLTFAAVLLIVLSTTPAPLWFYALATLVFVVWAFSVAAKEKSVDADAAQVNVRHDTVTPTSRARKISTAAMLVLCAGAVALEWRYAELPALNMSGVSRVYVIADSLSSGLGDEETWPKMLGVRIQRPVVNLARAGAQVADALLQTQKLEPGPALVLIEIGGNDVMGATAAADFERHLRVLLEAVKSPERRIAMFELPLPPLKHAFGAIQRRLAAEFGVTLIPKRILSEVVRASGATLDGLHLAPAGHRQMCERVLEMCYAGSD
jgi:acyl-CoA thioesterase I